MQQSNQERRVACNSADPVQGGHPLDQPLSNQRQPLSVRRLALLQTMPGLADAMQSSAQLSSQRQPEGRLGAGRPNASALAHALAAAMRGTGGMSMPQQNPCPSKHTQLPLWIPATPGLGRPPVVRGANRTEAPPIHSGSPRDPVLARVAAMLLPQLPVGSRDLRLWARQRALTPRVHLAGRHQLACTPREAFAASAVGLLDPCSGGSPDRSIRLRRVGHKSHMWQLPRRPLDPNTAVPLSSTSLV
mmetsp:Transcript_37679/g.87116  ORF Transcript_37679/g.87116 Transcript_37679/m.87116 type:complete len:246 (+) Transcript_37679:254-991(+)